MPQKVTVLTLSHPCDDARIFNREIKSLLPFYQVELHGLTPRNDVSEKNLDLRIIGSNKSGKANSISIRYQLFRKALSPTSVYHCHELGSLFIGWCLRLFNKAKLVYDVHEYWPESFGKFYEYKSGSKRVGKLFSWAVSRFESLLSKRCDLVIVVNDHMKHRFEHCDNVIVLPNYPRLTFIDQDFLKAGRNPGRPLEFIYLGGLSEDRGLFSIIHAAKKLKQKTDQPFRISLVGRFANEATREKCNRLIEDENLTESIDVVGQVPYDEVFNYLAKSDVGLFLLTSKIKRYHWGEPIKFFEYSAAGLPIIISDLEAKRNLVERSKSGFLVNPDDHDEVSDVMLRLMTEKALRDRLSRNARDFFTNVANWEQVEKKLLNAYSRMLDSPAIPDCINN